MLPRSHSIKLLNMEVMISLAMRLLNMRTMFSIILTLLIIYTTHSVCFRLQITSSHEKPIEEKKYQIESVKFDCVSNFSFQV